VLRVLASEHNLVQAELAQQVLAQLLAAKLIDKLVLPSN